MALRTVKIEGDPILTKKCREVTQMTDSLRELIADMIETMHEAQGVGLAAPQVGVMRRICVIDIGPDFGMDEPMVFVNPVIIEEEGEQFGAEGCLSLPGLVGDVRRPMRVVVRALDENMEEFEVEGEELMARALCHEIDHLDGKMYTELVEGGLREAPREDEE